MPAPPDVVLTSDQSHPDVETEIGEWFVVARIVRPVATRGRGGALVWAAHLRCGTERAVRLWNLRRGRSRCHHCHELDSHTPAREAVD